jgi:hypothetical protein
VIFAALLRLAIAAVATEIDRAARAEAWRRIAIERRWNLEES